MSTVIEDKTVLVVDSGWFVEIAPRLAREFGNVLYWSPWQGEFPYSQDAAVGSGLEGVTRVRDLHDAIPLADLVVFPAEGFADLQDSVNRLGIPTWGGGRGQVLEEDRVLLKHYLDDHKQPTIPFETVVGVEALRKLLMTSEDIYVKLAHGYRGDMETWHHEDWERTYTWFLDVCLRLGPLGATTVFLIEPPVEGFEGGMDWLAMGDQYSETCLIGYEIKDSCYVSTTKAYSSLPSVLRDGSEALKDWFKRTNYKNLVSTENRITKDNTSYLIDLAARFPWPPSGTMMEQISNLGEVMWYGTNGIFVEPDFRYRFGVELNLSSPWLAGRWLAVDFPASIRPWVKLHSAIKVGEKYWLRPQKGNGETGYVGSVVSLGDNFEKTIKVCIERAGMVKGCRVDFDPSDIEKAQEVVKEGEKHGIIW